MEEKSDQNLAYSNSVIIPINSNVPIEKQTLDMIQTLSTVKKEHCQQLYPKRFIITGFIGLALLIISIITLIYRVMTEQRINDLDSRQSSLLHDFFKNWNTQKIVEGGTCYTHYPINTPNCPPQELFYIKFCEELLNNYCQNFTTLNLERNTLPGMELRMALLTIGIFCLIISLAILTPKFYDCLTKISKAPPNIPKEHLNQVKNITNYLSINIDNTTPIQQVITLSRARLNELKENRARSILFFSGTKNQETPLQKFLHICDPNVLKIIFEYIDPLLVCKNTLFNVNNIHYDEHRVEETPLLSSP
jgi:hypothetical protein